jgi:FixJ family two-component response regulator
VTLRDYKRPARLSASAGVHPDMKDLSVSGTITADRTTAIVAIIDDDEPVRVSISSLVRSAGYGSKEFASAEAFLDSASMPDTDCLVLDVAMPGLNGLELQLLLTRYAIPIVFVTGQQDHGVRTRAFSQGAVAFLNKPVRQEDLLAAINNALEGSGRWCHGNEPARGFSGAP